MSSGLVRYVISCMLYYCNGKDGNTYVYASLRMMCTLRYNAMQ